MIHNNNLKFPSQRVGKAEKSKASWYADSIDYIIETGLSYNDRTETEVMISIQHGNIPDSFYKKTLNPYNSNNERFKRFPATMRNLDIINDIIRRYISEYYKGIHEFIVGADSPDIVFNKKERLKQEIGILAQQAFQQEFEKNFQQLVQQAQEQGQDPNQINPQDAMPDPEKFIKEFNEKYIDDESKQAQDILDYIRNATSDTFIYLSAFFNYASFGEFYTYTSVEGDTIKKECVPLMEAYPIPNSNFFVEDHDMFARKMNLTYQQIIDMFDDVLSKEDRKLLENYYEHNTPTNRIMLPYAKYFETHPDLCERFDKEERNIFKQRPINISEGSTNEYEVWHVVWRGEAKQGVLTYVNEVGMVSTRIIEEDYKMNPEAGDLNIEWHYKPQVYEGYRIGTRYTGIYPIKARAIPYNRNGKLPYNGLMEVLPYMGQFSIVKLISPYQIMRNIFAYHREMIIAKNKMLVLMMPESLIASNTEDKIYKMAADGVLLVDDTDDAAGTKMQHVRMLNGSLGDYITQLTNLMDATKQEAREMVDMNLQRYGDIATSAQVGTTKEAIARSSMGMVVLVTMFDEVRKRDYQRDIDYAKFAYIEGLNTTYWNESGEKKFISMDVNSFVSADYGVTVRNDAKEIEKVEKLKEWAFSAAQNGDLDMAFAAITGDNVTKIKNTVEKYMEIKRQHEKEMQEMEQMLKQEELQNKLQVIAAQGEQDRLTEELKYQYELQLKYVDVDLSMLAPVDNSRDEVNRLKENADIAKQNIEREKLNLNRQQMEAELFNRAADRQVKREDIASKERIAKINKNKYDK